MGQIRAQDDQNVKFETFSYHVQQTGFTIDQM